MKHFFRPVVLLSLIVSTSVNAICPDWTSRKTGKLDSTAIDEASGLVASKVRPGKFIWSNDSGGASELYGTDENGKLIKTTQISNFPNVDYEAVASGPCPSNKEETCLYVGDIGNNFGLRRTLKIGVFKEKNFWNSSSMRADKIIEFSYPNGSLNAEAMVVTPEGEILILTKIEGSSQIISVDVYGKAKRVAQIRIDGIFSDTDGKGPRITDASISPNGDRVLVLTYGDIIEIPLETLVAGNPLRWVEDVDYTLIKGPRLPKQETIEYSSDLSFIVSSESDDGEVPEIHTYTCKGY